MNTAPSWRERNQRGECYHGVCITQPCEACANEGYVRCAHAECRKLFMPEDGKREYCTDACRHAAAYQRQQAREMAREGI